MFFLYVLFIYLCSSIENKKDLRQLLQRSDFIINSADKFIDDYRNTLSKSNAATDMFKTKEVPKPHEKETIKRLSSPRTKLVVRKYIRSNPIQNYKPNQPLRISTINQRITEFPYFTHALNVSEFTQTEDKCNAGGPSYGYYIPIIIPPKKMLRVSTCNEDTTVFTPISVTYNDQCLQLIQRKCRRWSGNIIEYLPKSENGMEAIVRVGASNTKNAKVRITIYTVPITEKNKMKLRQGHIMRGNSKNTKVKVTTKKGDIVPTIEFNNSSSKTSQTPTTDAQPSHIIDRTGPNHSIQLLMKNTQKMGGWFKVCIAIVISVVVLTVGVIIFGSFRESRQPKQYAPF